jgi:hypothetical protein
MTAQAVVPRFTEAPHLAVALRRSGRRISPDPWLADDGSQVGRAAGGHDGALLPPRQDVNVGRRLLEFVPDSFRKPARNQRNLRASDSRLWGMVSAEIVAICRQKVDAMSLAVPFAMQKVEGSSPFSRFSYVQ